MDAARAALLAVSLVGAADSLYFILVTYGWMRPDPRWLPHVCRMDEATCARIVHTKEARLLGLPNAVYGLAWYALAGVAGIVRPPEAVTWGLLAVSAATVLVSVYLFYLLVARLKVLCPLCILGHVANYVIFGLLATLLGSGLAAR